MSSHFHLRSIRERPEAGRKAGVGGEQLAIFWGDPEVSFILQSLGFTGERASTSSLLPTQMSVQQRGIQGVVGARRGVGRRFIQEPYLAFVAASFTSLSRFSPNLGALED